MTALLVCPVCDRAHGPTSGSAIECGLPLVHGPGSDGPPKSELAIRARKVRPGYAEGPLVRVAFARHQAEAEMIQGLLLEEGIPSLVRRSGGFDVPDFLAAARATSSSRPRARTPPARSSATARGPRRMPPEPHAPWVRALAMTLARAPVRRCSRRRSPCPSSTRCPFRRARPGVSARRSRCAGRAREGDLERSDRPVRVRATGERDAGLVALFALQQVEDRAAQQERVGARRRVGRRGPSLRRRAIAGRTCRVWPDSHCAAPSTSHAQRDQRASRGARRAAAAEDGSRRRSGGRAARTARASASPASPRRSTPGARAPAGEHVEFARSGPADDVAAGRGRREPARERHPRLRGVELGGGGVQDDLELARPRLERSSSCARANSSCASTRRHPPRRARRGARRTSRRGCRPRPRRSAWQALLDLVDLLVGRPVDPVDQRLVGPAGRALLHGVVAPLVAVLAERVAGVGLVARTFSAAFSERRSALRQRLSVPQ